MTNLLKKPVTFEKVEFWAATAVYCLCVFMLLGRMITADDNGSPLTVITSSFPDGYYSSDYFLPQLLRYTTFYGWFLLIDLVVIRSFVKGRYVALNILLLPAVCIVCSLSLTVTDTWLRNFVYDQFPNEYQAHLALFKQEFVYIIWLCILLGFYNVAKQIIRANLPVLKMEKLGGRQLVSECLVALALLGLLAVFFRLNHSHWTITFVWCSVVLFGVAFYWYISFQLMPQINSRRLELVEYLGKTIPVMLILVAVFAVIDFIPFRSPVRIDRVFVMGLFNIGVALFLIIFTWYLNIYRTRRANEVQGLRTELGQSSANLDFLRSQINPHFLFNALNTLYGTALQENAERTGGGIQKLGDMMRFMLQENIQEKISLTREVDYLNNYIDLQMLRTQTSPDILIQTEIDEEIKGLEIAPMLLIPFVENAFKHGISLREPSHIKISLQTREKILFFDVSNSIHPKSLNDPERDRSGIGLENVKQRLQLLYPGRHELTIRESAKEFFIHLTVTLTR